LTGDRTMSLPEFIQAGEQTFRRAIGPGFDIIRQQLHEIDPNLELAHPEYAPQGWACLWNGPDGQWHAVTVNTSGDPRQLIMLPNILRERDGASHVNSRESAFERDIRKNEQAAAAREAEGLEAVAEAKRRVLHGLKKDLGAGHKTFFSMNSNRTEG
jgi:hypothetical protein